MFTECQQWEPLAGLRRIHRPREGALTPPHPPHRELGES